MANHTVTLQALYDRMKDFPEVEFRPDGVLLDRKAYSAFLEIRQRIERELLPIAHTLDDTVEIPRIDLSRPASEQGL